MTVRRRRLRHPDLVFHVDVTLTEHEGRWLATAMLADEPDYRHRERPARGRYGRRWRRWASRSRRSWRMARIRSSDGARHPHVPWRGRIHVRRDDPRPQPHQPCADRLRAAMLLASDLDCLRIALASCLGDRYPIDEADDASVIGMGLAANPTGP